MSGNARPSCRSVWRAIALAIICSCKAATSLAADDVSSWHALSYRLLDTERASLSAVGQIRFRDYNSELFAYYLGAQAVFKLSPRLRLGTNYTYLPSKAAGAGDFRYQHRLELELIPRWPITDRLTVDLRNRVELRRLEDRSGINSRLRLRPQATLQLQGHRLLDSYFANNETFYDLEAQRFSENRLVPLGLNFKAGARAQFSAYYMLRSVRDSGGWSSSHVLATVLSLRL